MSLEISPNPRDFCSPWPVTNVGVGSDVDYANRKVKLRKGMTVIEYMRLMYGNVKFGSVTESFNFLRRDGEEKKYTSITMDPFTMPPDVASIKPKLKKSVASLLEPLLTRWQKLGLPMKRDKDRGIDTADLELATSRILSALASGKTDFGLPGSMEEISFLSSNIAIMLKTALPRVVRPGWWLVSYAGNVDDVDKTLAKGMAIFKNVLSHILTNEKSTWNSKYSSACASLGDPLDTAVGYPFYTAEVDGEGNPISKLKVINKYKKLFSPEAPPQRLQFLEAIKARAATPFEREWPLAIGCIRRIQQGNKEQHAWGLSASGLKYDHDGRGFNTVRVAWAAPYILNLYLTPLQINMKALRMVIPGLYHDGAEKIDESRTIRASKAIPVESDFSNYDRTIPVKLMDWVAKELSSFMPHPVSHHSLATSAWTDVSVIWPDPSYQNSGGWAFTPKYLALLSGLKITSEIGTLCTYIVMLETFARSGKTIEEITSEQIKLIKQKATRNMKSPPPVLIQSDDILFLSTKGAELKVWTEKFTEVSSSLGMKAEIVIGDKFLMRHMTDGRDLPVTARWWQNTLSSESASIDPLIFIVGLFARTDGLLGYKGVDPFLTGKKQGIPVYQLPFLLTAWTDLLEWLNGAVVKHTLCIKVVALVVGDLTRLHQQHASSGSSNTRVQLSSSVITFIEDERIKAGALLAKRDLDALNRMDKSSSEQKSAALKFLSRLYNDRYSPASAAILASMTEKNAGVASILQTIAKKEYAFAIFACDQVGVKPFQPMS